MRRVFSLLFTFATVASVLAQPPTGQERERAVSELHASRKMFFAAVAGLSKAQLDFKPAPERWSVAECAEHIALAEDGYFNLITNKILKSPAEPGKKAEVAGKDDGVLKAMADRSSKRVTTEALVPTHRWKSIEEITAHFDASRDRLIHYVQTTQDDLRDHFLAHRAVGLIDAYQWILLACGHTVRHTLQINEVKADPKFPKR
jgi:uncharacterized damage-inducible protein DinB